METLRILALDGGGTRAGILARALGKIYGPHMRGREIVKDFHYVAGNSGGSIVMAALCCNYTPAEIAGLYARSETVQEMFSPRWTAGIPLLKYLRGIYSTNGKLRALRDKLDAKQQPGEPLPSTIAIHDWPEYLGGTVQLLVCAYDYDRERASFFRSNRASRAKSSAKTAPVTLLQAVHASTTPPKWYYDKPAQFAGRRFWDGALAGYNNPVLAAVVEALANEPERAADIRVLSLGAGTFLHANAADGARSPFARPYAGTGLVTSLRKVAGAVFGDPPDVASFHAHVMLGQPLPQSDRNSTTGHVVRVSPFVHPHWDEERNTWMPPDDLSVPEFRALMKMPLDSSKQVDLDLIAKMTGLWLAGGISNQPIRIGQHMRCDIGHETFSAALQHWQAIAGSRPVTRGRLDAEAY